MKWICRWVCTPIINQKAKLSRCCISLYFIYFFPLCRSCTSWVLKPRQTWRKNPRYISQSWRFKISLKIFLKNSFNVVCVCIEQAAKAKPAEKEKKDEKDMCVNGEFYFSKKSKGKIFFVHFLLSESYTYKHILAHTCSYLCVRVKSCLKHIPHASCNYMFIELSIHIVTLNM